MIWNPFVRPLFRCYGCSSPPRTGFPIPCIGAGKRVREQVAVVTVPVALKTLLGVVAAFEAEEFGELRVAGLDLLSGREAVISQIVAAVVADREIDQPPECRARFGDAL